MPAMLKALNVGDVKAYDALCAAEAAKINGFVSSHPGDFFASEVLIRTVFAAHYDREPDFAAPKALHRCTDRGELSLSFKASSIASLTKLLLAAHLPAQCGREAHPFH